MADTKYLIVLTGPTAVGKTRLSLELAAHFNIPILSADSRQLYREMSIGTAKPTEEELEYINHYFINHLSIQEDYNVGTYEYEAMNLLAILYQKSNVALVTGGTGLFIDALCNGLDEFPEVKEGVREELMHRMEEEGMEKLCEELYERDRDYYHTVDLKNWRRVIRALEVCISSGKPYSSFRSGEKKKRPFEIIKIALQRERAELYDRINLRVDQMLTAGLEEEAKALYPYKDKNALNTVGYKEVFGFMEGKYDRQEMIRLLKQNTRHYAKRQLTWLRQDEDYHWFHPEQKEEVIRFIDEKMVMRNT